MHEYPYWWDGIPALGAGTEHVELGRQKLDRLTYDVAIVGAGYTGLSAARRLARAGASVVVLEQGPIGYGASSRNGGQVLTGLRVDAATLVARYGETKARTFFAISLDAIAKLDALVAEEHIECELERSGHVQAAAKPAHFEAFREEQSLLARVFQHRVDLVPRQDQQSEVGTDRYHGLLIDERSLGVNPALYVLGLADAARRAGARLVERTAVRRIARQGTRWQVTTVAGDIDAGDVLVATNGYTEGVAPALQRRLVPIGSYVIATEPLDATVASRLLPRRRMAFDSKHFLYYFRVTRDRRLVFGGRAEFSRPSDATTRRAAVILTRGMIEVFPQLSETRVDFGWGGTVAFTRDEMPHAGRLDGMYYAAGYCGHGIAMATYLGDLVARRIAGEQFEHPLFDDTGRGFPAIPLYDGTPWFLPLAGAYYRLLDLLH